MKKVLSLLMLLLILVYPIALAEEPPQTEVASAITAALEKEAKSASDPWAKFLISQPITRLNLDEAGIARFLVPAWNPDSESLTGSEDGWLIAMWHSIHSESVEAEVSYEVERSGSVSITGGIKDFVSDLKRAAASAKDGFDNTNVRRALVARLLPSALFDDAGAPTEAFAALTRVYDGVFSQAQLQVALSPVKSPSLGVKNGPDKLRLVFYTGSARKLAEDALKDALDALSSVDFANAMTEEEIAGVYSDAFAERAAAFRQSSSKGDKRVLTVDYNKLMTDTLYLSDFVDYAKDMCQYFDQSLPVLVEQVRAFPDYPPRDQPETGLIFSAYEQDKGTLIILNAADDDCGRYLAFKDGEGNIALTAFVRSGDSLRASIPEGGYTLLCAKGVNWYGDVMLFMESGEYVATSEPFEVLDDTHYHAITFSSDEEGLPVRAAAADEFLQAAPATPETPDEAA